MLPVYPVEELGDFIEREKFYGLGLSLVDIQLLYAAILNDSTLWTHDGQLQKAALRFGKDYEAA